MSLTYFTHHKFPNVHLVIGEVITMGVTLNIPEHLVPFMENPIKGKTMWVHSVSTELKNINYSILSFTYNELMKKAMSDIRDAKINYLKFEKKKIKQLQIKF